MKNLFTLIGFFIFMALWGKLISWGLSFGTPDYPYLRARFGTVLWHSSDSNGKFLGAYNDPTAVDHYYCYYPKTEAKSNIELKQVNNIGDCKDWYGAIAVREAGWTSEKEKYWWSREQHIADCNGCSDL